MASNDPFSSPTTFIILELIYSDHARLHSVEWQFPGIRLENGGTPTNILRGVSPLHPASPGHNHCHSLLEPEVEPAEDALALG